MNLAPAVSCVPRMFVIAWLAATAPTATWRIR
jgi:hypothetical protein